MARNTLFINLSKTHSLIIFYAIQVKNQQLERLNLIKFLLNLMSKPKKKALEKGNLLISLNLMNFVIN